MERRRSPGRGGRPSRGERKAYHSRLPMPLSQVIDSWADTADVTYNDLIVAMLEVATRHMDELPPELQPKEVLPESA